MGKYGMSVYSGLCFVSGLLLYTPTQAYVTKNLTQDTTHTRNNQPYFSKNPQRAHGEHSGAARKPELLTQNGKHINFASKTDTYTTSRAIKSITQNQANTTIH